MATELTTESVLAEVDRILYAGLRACPWCNRIVVVRDGVPWDGDGHLHLLRCPV